jgi:hypothetical protein
MMTRSMKAIAHGLGVVALVLTALVGAPAALAPSEAHAVIGRPLTPGSYAGVARRTSRRTVRRTYAAAATAPVPYATALPPNCAMAGGAYACGGGAAYQPYYHGPEVVYVPVG